VVVGEAESGHLVASFMDPIALLQMTDNPEVAAVAQEVLVRLERVRSALSTAST
jgi:hypothetical protein